MDGKEYCKDCLDEANVRWKFKRELEEKERAEELAKEKEKWDNIACSKCNTIMLNGRLSPNPHSTVMRVLDYASGEYQDRSYFISDKIGPNRTGVLFSKVCPSCGYVESYVRAWF